jgi:hypothetical protein
MDQQHDCTLRSVSMKSIYGKFKGQRTFKAMDLRRGVQTNNLIFASLLTEEEANNFLRHTAPLNSDWQFEVRNAGTREVKKKEQFALRIRSKCSSYDFFNVSRGKQRPSQSVTLRRS